MQAQPANPDPYLLQCCLPNNMEPYIGVDCSCDRGAVFCINHGCHYNSEGLMHQMMPLRQFRRKIDTRKYDMQGKVAHLVDSFSSFIDRLIEQLREIKLRKSLELSMLWVRDLAKNQEQYELMKQVYRNDFTGISCRDVHSIYFKIIHNEQLYSKQISEVSCYQGIHKVLTQLNRKAKSAQVLAEKLSQLEGVFSDGQILKKVLPDRKLIDENMKQVLLDTSASDNCFVINYNKAKIVDSSPNFKPLYSKYPLIPHVTYHLNIKTKYSNILVGAVSARTKKLGPHDDIHYENQVVMYNFANGNTYKEGMFKSGSNAAIRGLKQLNIKLRLTDSEMFVMTNKNVLARSTLGHAEGEIYLAVEGRTNGDQVQIFCDSEITADNLKILSIIKQQQKSEQTQDMHQQEELMISSLPADEPLKTTSRQKFSSVVASQVVNEAPAVLMPAPKESPRELSITNSFGGIRMSISNNMSPKPNAQSIRQIDTKKLLMNQPVLNMNIELPKSNQFITRQKLNSQTESIRQSNKSRQLEEIRERLDTIKKNSIKKITLSPQPNQREPPETLPIYTIPKQMQEKSSEGDYHARNNSGKDSHSKVDINLSEQASELPSMIKGSMLSLAKEMKAHGMKLRRGSDTYEINADKNKGILDMSLSMQNQTILEMNSANTLNSFKNVPMIHIKPPRVSRQDEDII